MILRELLQSHYLVASWLAASRLLGGEMTDYSNHVIVPVRDGRKGHRVRAEYLMQIQSNNFVFPDELKVMKQAPDR